MLRHQRRGLGHAILERLAAHDGNGIPQVRLDQVPGFAVGDNRDAMLPQWLSQRRVRFAFVAATKQQDERPRHRLDRDQGRGDVGRLAVVDPEHTTHLAHRLHPMCQRPERRQAFGDSCMVDAGRVYRERRGQRVGDVVIPEQRQHRAGQQRTTRQHHDAAHAIVPCIGPDPIGHREREVSPRHPGHHPPRGRIVEIADPDRPGTRVAEELCLVGVVGFEGRISVEVIGSEVGEDADGRGDIGTVVQLERRQFHRQPLRLGRHHGHG